ncbi:MAG: methyl-accepting chemotaxis sensory transducer [Acidobacteria bacterium]|jgi:methyl-accepting chemotaxis protein|nr:methyl-accepting chemotaxis sensory transducer [Acidobacteriota bacterium]
MLDNRIWNLITKLFSLLAVFFLLLGAGLVAAAYFDFTNNEAAGVLTVSFAAVLAIFSLLMANYSNIRLAAEIREAAEIAHQISLGEPFADETQSELLDSLAEISVYLQEKAAIARQIAAGDLSARVKPRSDADDAGHAFQEMIDKLCSLVQTQDERDRLENSIRKLLNEVSEVAAGDLTVQAEVSPEMTGAIADAFNLMTRELRSLIRQVKNVTFQVSVSANAINDTTEQLTSGSEAQGAQITRTTSAIANMAVQIQEVSQNASLSAQVAGDSLGSARYGTKAVQDNINAMNSIRKQVQETAKRIKKLGERSQEISLIVGLLDDLSDRTSLLALNASLQASAAGESGTGFAVVAEEIERLAERSNRLTQQIAQLAQTIQNETKHVVASMEETIHEVVVGSTLADKAGQALIEIEQVSQRLAELLQSISESAKQQAKSSEDISSAMENISKITEQVQTGTKSAADSVKILVKLSEELRGSVAPFKLPNDTNSRKPAHRDANVILN